MTKTVKALQFVNFPERQPFQVKTGQTVPNTARKQDNARLAYPHTTSRACLASFESWLRSSPTVVTLWSGIQVLFCIHHHLHAVADHRVVPIAAGHG
jgi:hypothetical protein